MNFRKKYIGDKAFYSALIALAIPLIIQQGITNFVSLLDNLMVGRLGTIPMSSVSIMNQLIFVYNLTIFGGLSGASIFGAQFFGTGDWKGMRDTFRFRLLFGGVVSVLAIVILWFWGDALALLFMKSEVNDPADIALTVEHGMAYLKIALWGLVPFMVVQVYSGLLREMGETVSPMIASVIAILTNLVLNYIFIYGKLGCPAMGVAGAALATVIARFLEMGYIMWITHRGHARFRFIEGAYKSMHVPAELVRKIAVTGAPLMFNELLWSLGTTFVNANYSSRGLTVVAAMNIATTAWNLFCVIMFAMGSVVSIMVGQKLGAGDIEGAKDIDRKLIFANLVLHIAIGAFIVVTAELVPMLYKTEPEVRALAADFLRIMGLTMPISAFVHVAYFTIRSGGKTVVTFFFDSVYTWVVTASLSLVLCRYTALDVRTIFFIVHFSDIIKLVISIPMLRSGFWANNLVAEEAARDESEA